MLQAEPATHFSDVGSELGSKDLAYTACTQAGWPGEQSNFLLTIDLRDGIEHRAVSELHFPCRCDEVRALSWLSEGRSQLIAAARHSSQLYIVDVGSDPPRPRLVGVVDEDSMRSSTGCTRPVGVAGIGGSRAVVALQRGGAYGHGGLAIFADTKMELLTHGEDSPRSPICHLAVATETAIAAALVGDMAQGCDALAAWHLASGRLIGVQEIPAATSIAVTHDSPGECRGVIACKQGQLLAWAIDSSGLSMRTVPALEPYADRLVPASGLTASAGGGHVFLADWLSGVLVSYRLDPSTFGELTEVDRLYLVPNEGEAHDRRWSEIMQAHGRKSIGGPLNLALTPDGSALVVTNGAWQEVERLYYGAFTSWFLVARVRDGQLRVDEERTMSTVNRPRGQARYGPALTSWVCGHE